MCRYQIKALTTIEILLVVTIMAISAVASFSFLVNYQSTAVVDSELQIVTARIQKTRQQAIGNATGESYSIKFLSGTYVAFPGTVYNANDPDNQVYYLDAAVIVDTSFPSDTLTFANFTGRVASPGTVTISSGIFTKEIVINSIGIVEDIL